MSPKQTDPSTLAALTAYTTFKELEYHELKPHGYTVSAEVLISRFEDRPGAVWRVMRLYVKPDGCGVVAIKTQVTRESTPFVVFYQETKELACRT